MFANVLSLSWSEENCRHVIYGWIWVLGGCGGFSINIFGTSSHCLLRIAMENLLNSINHSIFLLFNWIIFVSIFIFYFFFIHLPQCDAIRRCAITLITKFSIRSSLILLLISSQMNVNYVLHDVFGVLRMWKFGTYFVLLQLNLELVRWINVHVIF